jgi:hypothetical protein
MEEAPLREGAEADAAGWAVHFRLAPEEIVFVRNAEAQWNT